MSSLFISHASADGPAAQAAARRLEAWGYRSLFLDFDAERGIAAGSDWEAQLYRHLKLSRALVALVSEGFVASHWCFAEVTQARSLGKPVFPLKIGPCTPHSLLADLQIVDLTRDEEEGWERLRRGLEAAGLGEDLPFDPARPYPGLSAFDAADAGVFQGREEEQAALLETLERMRRRGEPRLALVLGASGSGKSSLVRAGVLPRLAKDSRHWLAIPPWRPGDAPARELGRALADAFGATGPGWRAIAGALEAEAAVHPWIALADDLREAKGQRDAAVLVVIDQLEELFASSAGDEVARAEARFRAQLRSALEAPGSPLFVLATLRSDFLGSFQTAPELRGLPFENLPLGPMPLERLPRVITGPATRVGLDLEEGLVERLVADTGSGDALPLLAFTLRQLYERRQGERITADLYERELGSIEGAVAVIAEGIVAGGLGVEEEKALRSAFLHMVRLDEEGRLARRPAPWDELPERARPVLERFVDERLLVSNTTDGARHVEVAHEALFRAWQRLVLWLEEARELLHFRQRLGRVRAEWLQVGEAPEALLRGPALAEAERWLGERPDDLTADEQRFVAASTAWRQRELEAQRRRRWRVTVGLAAGLVGALALSALAGWQWHLAEQQRRLAVASQLATEARARSVDSGEELVRGLSLATESLRSAWTPEGYAAWATAIRALGTGPAKRIALTAPVTGLAVHPQRPWVAVREGENVVHIYSLDPGNPGVEVMRLDVPAKSSNVPRGRTLAFSPDGRWLAAADGPVINVWGSDGWRLVKSLTGWDSTRDLAFSPDGELLVAAQTTYLFGPVDTRTWALPSERSRRFPAGQYAMSVAFLPGDGTRFAVGNAGFLELWSVVSGSSPPQAALLQKLSVEPRTIIKQLALGPGGRGLAWEDTCCPRAFTWPVAPDATSITVATEERCKDAPGERSGHRLEGSSELTLACRDSVHGHVWVARPLGSGATWLATPQATATMFSADGRWLIVGGQSVELYDLENLASLRVPRALHPARAVAWSPDARWLAAGGSDALVRVYHGKTFEEVYHAEEEDSSQVALAFSRNGRLVARADSVFSIFEVGGGGWKRLARFDAGQASTVSLSPDGLWAMTLISAYAEARSGWLNRPSRTQVWSLKDGIEVAWRTHEEADIKAFLEKNPRFTRERLKIRWEQPPGTDSDEARLPLGEGGRLELLDQASGWESMNFDAPRSSPDGHWAIKDGSLLDPASERTVVKLASEGVNGHAWSPDLGSGSEWLALAQYDGVRVWRLGPVAALVEAACARLPRNLTSEEWPLGGKPPVTCPLR